VHPLTLLLLHLAARVPLPLLHGCGVALGWLGWLVPNRNKTIARRNLELAFPELEPAARRALLRRTLIETAKAVLETPRLWLLPCAQALKLIREVHGQEVLDQAMASGRGVIVASPHLGNWELWGLYLARHQLTALYRPPRKRAFEDLIRTARERCGSILVPTDARGVRALYQALGRGGIIGILPDQDPRGEAGVFAPFFGVPAMTMTLLPRLAHKSGAPVIFTYAERLPWGRGFHVHFLPAPAAINSADMATAAAALNQGLEQCVRRAPEQYQWIYKRFRTRPQGEAPRYRKTKRRTRRRPS
jgi:KDO2-lipid IV(A) lauroyltransferase